MKIKKQLIRYLPYALIGLYASKIGQLWRLTPGTDMSQKFLNLDTGAQAAFSSPLPSFNPQDLLLGLLLAVGLRLAVIAKGKNAKKYRHNVEYGSARWGTPADIQPFMDDEFANNIILTATERITISNRAKIPTNSRNNNVLIVGGSGSGKTWFWLMPNIMQCDGSIPCSFVVTDPKGGVVIECGNMLLKKGYRVMIFNTINFGKSMHYNPFSYIHGEKDILKLVTTLISNTKGEGKSGDDFWIKAETLLYTALIAYIHYEAPTEEQNFATLVEMINSMETREDDEDFQNQVDFLFEELEHTKPDHFAVRQYKKFKLAAGVVCFKRLLNQSIGKSLKTYNLNNHERSASNEKKRENHSSLRAFEP